MIFIFVFEKCQNLFWWGPHIGPFWSAKYLNFKDESCEISILPHSIQEKYALRKAKSHVLLFQLSWEPNLSDQNLNMKLLIGQTISRLWNLSSYQVKVMALIVWTPCPLSAGELSLLLNFQKKGEGLKGPKILEGSWWERGR